MTKLISKYLSWVDKNKEQINRYRPIEPIYIVDKDED